MATSLTTDTLVVTITERATINGRQQGGSNSIAIASIKNIMTRIIGVGTTECTLYTTDPSATAGNVFDEDDVKYVRITNKDKNNYITLTIENDRGEEAAMKLQPYSSMVLFSHKDVIDANQADLTFVDATCDFTASSTTATCDASANIKVGQNVNAVNVPNRTVATVNTPGAVTSFTINSGADGSTSNELSTFTINQTSGLTDLSKITCQSDSDTVDLELYIASV